MKNRFDNWVNGLAWDWCISRQLPFGIPFPVWYCKDCDEIILAREEDLPVDPTQDKPPVDCCPKCNSKNIMARIKTNELYCRRCGFVGGREKFFESEKDIRQEGSNKY